MENFRSCTPSDLRALVARKWDKPLFMLAAQIGVHPGNLSRQLREKDPLQPQVARRLFEVLGEDMEQARSL